MEKTKHPVRRTKIKKTKVWQMTTLVLAVLLIVSVVLNFSGESKPSMTRDEVAGKTVDYINTNLMQGQGTVTLKSIEDTGDLYVMTIDVNGQEIESYATKDGKLFFPQVLNMDDKPQLATPPAQEPPKDLIKSDKPTVELFVMSHCPYGTQMEKGMLPVIDTLGDKVDFELKFVNYAMHGQKEIDEQLNQYCIQKEYPEQFNDYLYCFLDKGEGTACIEDKGFDAAKIATCAENTDEEFGISEAYADKSTWKGSYPSFNVYNEENLAYGVGGSPTLIINGAQVNSARDSQSLLTTICEAFNDAPSECGTDLTAEGNPSPGFGFNEGSPSAAVAGCGV